MITAMNLQLKKPIERLKHENSCSLRQSLREATIQTIFMDVNQFKLRSFDTFLIFLTPFQNFAHFFVFFSLLLTLFEHF